MSIYAFLLDFLIQLIYLPYSKKTDLCWHGNQTPAMDNWELMTAGQFFKSHVHLPQSDIYLDNMPKHHAGVKGNQICLEFCINWAAVSLIPMLVLKTYMHA